MAGLLLSEAGISIVYHACKQTHGDPDENVEHQPQQSEVFRGGNCTHFTANPEGNAHENKAANESDKNRQRPLKFLLLEE